MKRTRFLIIATTALVLVCAGTMRANTDPSTLFINGGGGDPNLISGGSFVVLQNSGGAGTIANLILLFSVPGVTSLPSGISGLTSSVGTVGSITLPGVLATSPGCNGTPAGKDVYSCAGISDTNQSNSLVNFNTAQLAINGFTAGTYGIFAVTITGANLGPGKDSITITGNFPIGTFVDAFGIDNTGTPFSTPFTEAGLVVPEPGTLALFGSGLIGIATAIRRRLSG